MKASRNRTIEILEEERPTLRRSIVGAGDVTRGFDFADKTINGDMAAVLPLMPDSFADLIIVDPPYNLSKDFNGMKFRARSDDEPGKER